MSETAVQIICKGKVQGVFFRASTKTEAEKLGLAGWVRNEPNGDVLIHAQGEESEVERLISWCHRGPQFARVDLVLVSEAESEAVSGFEVRYF